MAAQLGLPAKITDVIPLNQQVPERYRPLFAEGCSTVMRKQVPARFSGAFEHDFKAELFRAVFLPIRLHPSGRIGRSSVRSAAALFCQWIGGRYERQRELLPSGLATEPCPLKKTKKGGS